jgi:hypothetical protein
MRKFQFLTLLGFLFIFICCNKDDINPENLKENTIVFNGEKFDKNSGYVSYDDSLNTWTFSIRVQYDSESVRDSITGAVHIGGGYFKIQFKLVSIDNSSIKGTYNLGDINGDGANNELDASDAGYCSLATLEKGEIYTFDTGTFTLNEITIHNQTLYDEYGNFISSGDVDGLNLQFSLKNVDNIELAGNIVFNDSRK